jgi:putative oxidoreductase
MSVKVLTALVAVPRNADGPRVMGGLAMDFEAQLNKYQPQVLSILRIMTGLLFLQHGLQKWFGIPVASSAFANIRLLTMIGIAGVIETVCGSLVTVGLFTRYAAFVASGEMAVAYFTNHLPRGFAPIGNAGNLAVVYCFVFFYLIFAGAGPWSLDAVWRKKP